MWQLVAVAVAVAVHVGVGVGVVCAFPSDDFGRAFHHHWIDGYSNELP